MLGNVRLRRRYSNGRSQSGRRRLIDGLAAITAEFPRTAIGLAAVWTGRFEPRSALVAERRVGRIIGLASWANHNGNQSQISCIVPNSSKADLRVRLDGSRQSV